MRNWLKKVKQLGKNLYCNAGIKHNSTVVQCDCCRFSQETSQNVWSVFEPTRWSSRSSQTSAESILRLFALEMNQRRQSADCRAAASSLFKQLKLNEANKSWRCFIYHQRGLFGHAHSTHEVTHRHLWNTPTVIPTVGLNVFFVSLFLKKLIHTTLPQEKQHVTHIRCLALANLQSL